MCYLVGLDPLDIAGEITVELELINVFVFSLCCSIFVAFGGTLPLHLFLQCCFGYRWLNGHRTILTPDTRRTGRRISVSIILADSKPQSKSKHDYCVTRSLQCFHVGKRLRVFGNHIGQDVLHTCSYLLHWGQAWQKNKMCENIITAEGKGNSYDLAYLQHPV